MGGACSRKSDQRDNEEILHRGVSRKFCKSGSSKWLATSFSRPAIDIQLGRGNCPLLMDLCIRKICEDIDRFNTFSMLPRDISQQIFNELVYSQRLTDVSLKAFRDCAIQDLYLGEYPGVNDSWMDVISSQGPSLLSVDLSGSEVTDTGLLYLKECTNLLALNFDYCDQISDRGLELISGLSNLTSLSFRRNNAITAKGMSAFANLVNLVKLNLERCPEIHGGLINLKGLSKLESLNLKCCNCITNDDMKPLSGLTNLKALQISCSRVTDFGITFLKGLHKLSLLNLEGCPVTAACLDSLSALAALLYLNLNRCSLSDDGCENLSRFRNLKVLNLGFNEITDACLVHLKGLTNLESLNLDSCKIGDEGLVNLTGLRHLKCLELSDTEVGSSGLRHLSGLANLESLNLSFTVIDDGGLRKLSGLSSLKSLNLDVRQISDAGLAALTSLTGLNHLDLFGARITDAGTNHLRNFKNLRSLEICGGGLTDTGVKNIKNLSYLRLLNLSQNSNLTDKTLELISGLTELVSLNVSNSRITSVGLRHLKTLKNMKSLTLEGCKVTANDIKRLQSTDLPNLIAKMLSKLFRSNSTSSLASRSTSLPEIPQQSGIINSEEYEVQDLDLKLGDWNLPKVPLKEFYKSSTWKFSSFKSDFHVRTIEQVYGINKEYETCYLFSPDQIKAHINKGFHFIHIGLVQVGVKPLIRSGLNNSVLLALRDTRHVRFDDSLLGTVQASLSNGPVHFDCFPNFTVHIHDKNVLQALTLNIKTHGTLVTQGTSQIALIYRVYYKCIKTNMNVGALDRKKCSVPCLKRRLSAGYCSSIVTGILDAAIETAFLASHRTYRQPAYHSGLHPGRWPKGMTARNVKFETTPLWVQIWDAPFDMVSPKVATEVGSRLGVVVELEKRQKLEAQCLFMRVQVSIPISKPIRGGSDGTHHWVNFKYERLAMFCHFCGMMGHDLRHCASYFAASKNSGEVVSLNLNHEEINIEAKNLEEARELLSLKKAHVLDKPTPNGPANTKPKWTRIPRMDCGFRGLRTHKKLASRGTRGFKFEEAWLLWDECEAVVQDGWSKVDCGNSGLNGIKDKTASCGMGLHAWGSIKTHPDTERIKELQKKVETINMEAILRIPLSRRHIQDSIYWIHNSEGEYTIKSGYQLARQIVKEENMQGECSKTGKGDLVWSTLRKLHIPNKLKLFGWRFCHDILPTHENLARKTIIEDWTCELCIRRDESSLHVMWECSVAQDVWAGSIRKLQKGTCEARETRQLVEEMIQKLTLEELELFFVQAWLIWSQWNMVTHGGKLQDPSRLV
ncbi:hypothetical protein SO802_005884 [Lithocarpus litseifolius]|uniref:Uncharacterized protein n=1 Tax=Lithocarpus litseifolius TaxID=425828 RepID=A0AAW2DPY0_9ROSI